MLVEYIQNSPARSLILGCFRQKRPILTDSDPRPVHFGSCPAHSAALSEPVREVIVHMRKCCRMTPASIALCIPSPRSMAEGASAAWAPQVRSMGVLLLARGLASRRICVHYVRRMMLAEYIQNSPARALARGVATAWCVVVDVRLCLWYFALLGGGGADEGSSAGRAREGAGAGAAFGRRRGALLWMCACAFGMSRC